MPSKTAMMPKLLMMPSPPYISVPHAGTPHCCLLSSRRAQWCPRSKAVSAHHSQSHWHPASFIGACSLAAAAAGHGHPQMGCTHPRCYHCPAPSISAEALSVPSQGCIFWNSNCIPTHSLSHAEGRKGPPFPLELPVQHGSGNRSFLTNTIYSDVSGMFFLFFWLFLFLATILYF